jgi:DNA-binding CsgD family transcriptional regulator/tetratricopeptide (TPR) repeat protein
VCADAEEDRQTGVRVAQADVADVLVRLVAKSLVVAGPDGRDAKRYRLLETLRQYGRDRLVQREAADAMQNRHADFFLVWARRHLSASDTLQPLAEASIELDNLRAALRWLLDKGEANRVLQLGAALRWYWFRQGHLTEGAGWYAEILALAGAEPETEELAHVLAAAGLIASRQGRAADAEPLYTRALGIWRKLGNDLEVARSLAQLGTLFRHAGRLSEALQCFEEGSTLCEDRCFAVPEGINRIGLAETLYDLERYGEALAQAGRALDISEASGYARALSWAKRAIGLVHYQRGAQSAARRLLEDALDEARKVEGPGWWLADALACVAQLDIDAGRFDRAQTLLRDAVDVSMVLGDQRMIARCLDRLAHLATAERAHGRAIRLAAAADWLRTRAGLPRAPAEDRTVKRWLLPSENALEPAVRDRARRDATAMSLDRVLAYALDGLSGSCDGPASRSHSVPDRSPLSPREREVAVLVARGLSNPRIAAELIIGERTVQTHVGNILGKLGLSSRVQVAAWVAEHYGPGAADINP